LNPPKNELRKPPSAAAIPTPPATGLGYLAATLAQPVNAAEAALRPLSFRDFTGQPKTVERLQVMVGAAKRRGEALNHILLSGPPGLGKTTLAFILGHEMGRNVRVTSGPVVEKAGDLAGLLTSLEEGDLLFIDEIHRIPKTVEEYLYSAMEDFRLDIMIDQGPNARSVRLSIPRFTLIGATTRAGLLTAPLRSRFTLQTRLDYYDVPTLMGIVQRSCSLLRVSIADDGAREIAQRSRGTPRIANNLINFCRDYAQERAQGKITQPVAAAALELLEIDARGLDEMDKRMLRVIAENYRGGPVGLGTIAVAVGEETETLEEVHEPFLIQEGYLQRTPQGRVITERGLHAIGLKSAAGGDAQTTLL
jgi:Holliday junction DNA helicase RuvB